jgi:hypothetical protein
MGCLWPSSGAQHNEPGANAAHAVQGHEVQPMAGT